LCIDDADKPLTDGKLHQSYTVFDMIASNNETPGPSAEVRRIGRRLAGARVERGLSQAQLAQVVGTSPARISTVETARADIQLGTLTRIATALGLRVALVDEAA
jgi:ribosome-binding protein aMBF1 (putative translation factor)